MTLYRKHRPQIFSTIIGQESVTQTLQNQIRTGRVAHAYLFFGPRGVGKTTTARVLAKALNCSARAKDSTEPCDACASCTDIANARSIDVIEMDAASHTGVDNVRENIIENAQFRPTAAPYKIFIIDEVHMLSASAFNALLKILEEPPAHIVFILATTDLQKLPETIVSRCQRFTFKKIPEAELKKHLDAIAKDEGVRVDAEVMRRIIRKSDGCARDAVSLLDQMIAIGETHITADVASVLLPTSHLDDVRLFVEALAQKNAAGAISAIDQTVNRGMSVSQFAIDAIELLRLLLVAKNGGEMRGGADIAEEDLRAMRSASASATMRDLVELTDMLLLRRQEIKTSPIPQLPLELAALLWCDTASGIPAARAAPHAADTTPAPPPPPASAPVAPPPPASAPTPPPTPSDASSRIPTPDEATNAWRACIKLVEAKSASTAFIMNMATVDGSDGLTLRLRVPYALHKDKLTDAHSRRLIETQLQELLGARMTLAITVQEDERRTAEDAESMAALFGGEVVSP
jgi:DNA polymerase-3 subunit gamma/tau